MACGLIRALTQRARAPETWSGGPLNNPFTSLVHKLGFASREHLAMAGNLFSKDNIHTAENWDACWNALESLADRDLPPVAMHAEAARIINSCRAVTEGRGIEHIEDRARAAYRLAADRLAAGSNEHLNRFMVALDGALRVLRQVRWESPNNPR